MSKVYAVSEGCYSDYRIRAIFSTREKAQAMIDWIKAGPPGSGSDLHDVEEWELDEVAPPASYRDSWFVYITMDGDITECEREQRGTYRWPPVEEPTRAHPFPHRNSDHLEVHAHADNEEHAKKIAVECLQRFRAEKAGVS